MQAKTKRRVAVTSLLAVAIAAVGGAFVVPSLQTQDTSSVAGATVTRGDLTVTVTGSGELVDRYTYSVSPGSDATLTEQAGQSVDGGSAPAVAGYETTRIYVSGGDHVSSGQRLAVVKDAAGKKGTVKTPVAGYVRSVMTTKGASVSQVATIGAGRQLASMQVSEYDIVDVKLGQEATITVSSLDEALTGRVRSIGQTADDSSGVRQYQVLVSVEDLPRAARMGMSVTAEIATASEDDVLLIPATAITDTGDGSTVEVVRADGTTQVVAVELGLVGASDVEVLSGLAEGDDVVTGVEGDVPASSSDTAGPGGGGPPAGGF